MGIFLFISLAKIHYLHSVICPRWGQATSPGWALSGQLLSAAAAVLDLEGIEVPALYIVVATALLCLHRAGACTELSAEREICTHESFLGFLTCVCFCSFPCLATLTMLTFLCLVLWEWNMKNQLKCTGQSVCWWYHCYMGCQEKKQHCRVAVGCQHGEHTAESSPHYHIETFVYKKCHLSPYLSPHLSPAARAPTHSGQHPM